MLWPKFNRDGQFCITFDYHMFGFHINELQLAMNPAGRSQIIHWSRQGQKGNMWLEAEANVYLTSSDQVTLRQHRSHDDSFIMLDEKLRVRLTTFATVYLTIINYCR